jgi:potassium efflux system protein
MVVLLLAAAGCAGQAGAEGPGADVGAAGPRPTASSGVTLGDIGKQAAAVQARLRAMTDALSGIGVAPLASEVMSFHDRVSDRWTEMERLLNTTPRRAPVEAVASSWRVLRLEMVGLQARLDTRAQRLDIDGRSLDRLRKAWSWKLEQGRRIGVPAPVVAHIESTLAAIDATRAEVEEPSAQLLLLQDSLTQSIETCDDAAARTEAARRQAVAIVLTQRQPPMWSLGRSQATAHTGKGPARLADELAARTDSLRIYFEAHRAGFVLTGLFVMAALLALYRARERPASADVSLPQTDARVIRAPLATAILLTAFCSRPLRPDPPLDMQHLVLLFTLPAGAALLRRFMDPPLVPVVYALPLFFLVDMLRGLLVAMPVAEQLVLTTEMGVATWLFLWVAAQLPASAGALREAPGLRAIIRSSLHLVALCTAAAAGAATVGYLELADLVGGGALGAVYMAVALLGIRIAATGVLALVLADTPLARLRTVQVHGAAIERGVGRALDVVVLVAWVWTALELFELLTPANALLRGALDARLRVGELDLSAGRLLGVVAVVLVAWLVSRIVVFALDEDVYARLDLPRGVPYALSSLTRYGLLLVGFLLALGALGLDLTRVTILVSAFGLGIGFGLQQIVNNFVSGLILLFERPVQVGDAVQLGDLVGDIERIGIRSSTIRKLDGAEVIVPNSSMLEEKVINWTLSDRKRRVDLAIGVAYGTDASRVIALLVDVARQVPAIMSDPAPDALFIGFGDSALNFELRVWTTQRRWARVRSDLAVALQRALAEAGIVVPFPQRDVHVRHVGRTD